jgi:hypothetical protein
MNAPLYCPVCSAQLPDSHFACDMCTVKIMLDAAGRPVAQFPNIVPGEALVGLDFRQVPLPGESKRQRTYDGGTSFEPAEDGILFTIRKDLVTYLAQSFLHLRDGVARADIVTIDPYIEIRVFCRMITIGEARVRYELVVRPTERQFSMTRNCAGGPNEASDAARIFPWTSAPAIAPHGYPNVLELRFEGPTLQAWVNGQYIAAVHDPALGIGQVGMCITASTTLQAGEGRRALFRWFEARTVVA